MISLALLVCVVGLIIFLVVNKPERQKIATVGLVMFAVGLGAYLLGPGADILRGLFK